jgi:hypothetical protein
MWRKVMKRLLVVMFFAASVFAQALPAGLPAACGPENVTFKVKLDETQHTVEQPEAGKARVYLIQDKGIDMPMDFIFPVANIGLDGAWLGANWNNSYFNVSVEPGEHHLCAYMQSGYGGLVGLLHFTAEAGKVYYFNARIIERQYGLNLFFDPVDSDQARYQIATFPLSISTPQTPKKPKK